MENARPASQEAGRIGVQTNGRAAFALKSRHAPQRDRRFRRGGLCAAYPPTQARAGPFAPAGMCYREFCRFRRGGRTAYLPTQTCPAVRSGGGCFAPHGAYPEVCYQGASPLSAGQPLRGLSAGTSAPRLVRSGGGHAPRGACPEGRACATGVRCFRRDGLCAACPPTQARPGSFAPAGMCPRGAYPEVCYQGASPLSVGQPLRGLSAGTSAPRPVRSGGGHAPRGACPEGAGVLHRTVLALRGGCFAMRESSACRGRIFEPFPAAEESPLFGNSRPRTICL